MDNEKTTQNGKTEIPHHLEPHDGLSHLKHLFQKWQSLDDRLSQIASKGILSTEDENECDHIMRAQSVIMNTAAIVPGRTYSDVLYKLAFWRWDSPELESSLDRMKSYESLAYSAFRDLIEITGDISVMNEVDTQTNLLRLSEVR